MPRMINAKNKKDVLDNLKKAYGYEGKTGNGLEILFDGITKNEADIIQHYFNDVYRKGMKAQENWELEQQRIANGESTE